MWKNYIFNKLNDTQYNIYSSINSANELWKALDKKFKVEQDNKMEKLILYGPDPSLKHKLTKTNLL